MCILVEMYFLVNCASNSPKKMKLVLIFLSQENVVMYNYIIRDVIVLIMWYFKEVQRQILHVTKIISEKLNLSWLIQRIDTPETKLRCQAITKPILSQIKYLIDLINKITKEFHTFTIIDVYNYFLKLADSYKLPTVSDVERW